jgi:hypothetical protein
MKIEEWKIDEHIVVVAVIFDWFGWLVWRKYPVFSSYYFVIVFFSMCQISTRGCKSGVLIPIFIEGAL